MTTEFLKDAKALIRACRSDRNCPLKDTAIDGRVFKFKIQQNELKFNVKIRGGVEDTRGIKVKIRTDTGTINRCTDDCLLVCVRKVLDMLGCIVPYINGTSPARVPTTPKTMTIDDKYLVYLDNKLGKGGHGDVYKGINTVTNTPIAVKIHHKHPDLLEKEAALLSLFTRKEVKGIPKCYWKGFSHGKYCLVMEYLGKDISELMLTHRDVLMIFIKSLSIIEEIHKLGHLHIDLKDENIMIGKENPNDIYICDFGLAMPIMPADPLKPVVYRGYTPVFASINMLRQKQPGRKDDLLTLGYAVLQMIRNLPWSDCLNVKQIFSEKTKMSTSSLCNGLPVEFELYLDYCNTLDLEDTPNYAFLRQLFQRVMKNNKFDCDSGFSWGDFKSPRHDVFNYTRKP